MRPSFSLQATLVAFALLPAVGVLLAGGGALPSAVALALGPLAAGAGWALAQRTIAARLERLGAAAEAMAAGDLSVRGGLRRGGLGVAGRGLEVLGARVEELTRREQLLEASGEGIVAVDPAGRISFANPAAGALLGVDRLALHGRAFHDVVHRGAGVSHPAKLCPLLDAGHDGRVRRGEDTFAREPGGGAMTVEYTVSPVVEGGRDAGVGIAFHGVTERQRTEERLRHADRMEVVAQLAAGVAHDFNNLLAVILSCANALREELLEGEAWREADEITRAAQRGAALVRQLLDFGRRAPDGARLVDPNALVLSIEGMLRRALGDRVRLSLALAPEAGRVWVDPARLEQALLALVLNARDAQPEGGAVELSTEAIDGSTSALQGRRWVRIGVRDHGPVLAPEAQARLFEPFFSPNQVGGGLGLATVYGFAKQAGGEIDVQSAPGDWHELRGSETVLVVDDDPALAAFARQLLEELGYVVLEASSAEQAAAVSREHPGPIHLLVAHVAMPDRSGVEIADALRRRRPEMTVLYTSDSAAHPALTRARVPHAAILIRPYHAEELLGRVRAALGTPAG